MAEFKTITIADIIVPERLRMVEEDHALAIQASIVEHGLINPISVRRTPPATKPFKPYTLVTGAHRLRAMELLDEREIEALIVEADKDEAVLVEISENLFRNELSALDRATFVITYREAWERKHGKIRRGGQTVKFTESPLDQIADEAARGFSVHVADKLGCSVSAVEKAQFLGSKLDPALRQRLRGTADADNQSLLLKLAKMEPARQGAIAAAMALGRTLDEAIGDTDPAEQAVAKKPMATKRIDAVIANYGQLGVDLRRDVLRTLFEKHPEDLRWAIIELAGLAAAARKPRGDSEIVTGGGGRASRPAASHDLRRDRG